MTEYKKLNHMLLIMFMIGISFFCVEKTNAYFQFTKTSTTSFTTATYQNLELATDKNLYGLCNQDATILLTVGNTNTYNMGYTITFSNNNLDYTIDGAPATTYTLPGNGSKTHTIVVSGTTQTSTLTITVTPNSPYGSIHTKVVNFDLICPVCTWGGVSLPNLTATLTQNYEITCTDTGSGMTSPTLGTSNFISSNTNVAKINSVSAPSAVTNGYKYTLTVEGLKAGSFSLTMKAGATKDQTNNQNNITTSTTINTIRRTPTMTVSSNTSTLTYGGTNGSITYTYSGNGVPSLTNTAPEVATAIIDTANKTITITPVTAGSTTIGLVAPETNQYTTISKNIVVTVNKRAVTYKANNASKEYDGSALTNASGCTLTSGSLISGHIATCTNSGTITNYGNSTNTLNTVVIKSGSTDVSSNYAITKTNGTLSISKRTVTITAGTTSKTYDGSALTYSVCSGNRLVSGHTVTCTMTAGSTITNYTSGGATNTISAAVIKSGSTDLTNNYAITNATGTLTINKRPVTYKADNASKTYDGSALTNASGCTITSGSLVSGHTVTCTNTGTITNYGSTTNTLSTVVIKSGTTDVSSNYAITKTNGTLSISKRAVTYKANNASKEYDGTALTNASGCTITSGSLVSGHAATCTNTGTITNYGSTTNTLDTVIIKSGATDVSNNYNITKTNGTLSISKRTVTITAGTTSKTYDGSALTYATCSGNRLVSGQTVTCTMTTGSTITNVGSETNTISTRVIKSGSTDLTNNYTITNATGTLTINKKTLTPSATASNKTYNGNTSATCAITLSGAVSGESPTATASGAFNNATVGTGKTVTCSSITLGSSWTTNYSLSTTSVTTTANITKKSLTPSATASNKTYNGNTSATCAITLSGAVSGESPTATASGAFNNATVGTGKTVTCSSITLGSSWTTNYSLSTTSVTTTANITKKSLTPSATASNKTYNGNTSATCAITLSGAISGESPTATGSGTFANANVGTGKTVTCSGITLGSSWTTNYSLSTTSVTTTANITARAVTYKADNASKTYDGSALTNASGCTITSGSLVSGHTVTCTNTGSITNSGSTTNTLSTVVIKSGTTDVSSNYAITKTNGTLTINKKQLTVSGTTASNKTYNATTAAATTLGTVSGVVSGDAVTTTVAGTFDNKNVGTGKTVTLVYSISGTDAENYIKPVNGTTTANITKKALTITGLVATNRVYDGSTSVTLSGGTLNGKVSGDTVTATMPTSGTIASANVGTGKAVTYTTIAPSGTDAGNYSITQPSVTVNITQKQLTVSGTTASNKTYNATTAATTTLGTISGVVSGDAVTTTVAGTFDNKNVGTGKTVTLVYSISGTDAGNYIKPVNGTTTANITKKALTITGLVATNRVYDGSTSVTLSGGTLNGKVSGDTVTATMPTSGTIASANVGTGKAVTYTTIAPSGTDAGNYSITQPTVTVNITQKQLTVSGTTASNKTYNATTAATTTLGTVSGVVSGDAVTTTVAGTFDNKNVGTGKTVTLVYSISGTDAGNYIKPVNGTTTANITKKALTITGLVATNRVYDGSTSVTLSGGTLNGKVNGDTVTATMPTSGTIASANVGTGKAVTYTTIAPSGTDAGNYSITQPTVTVNITVRPITITAKNQTIIEGNSIATGVGQVTYTATSTNGGLVSGHSLDSITLTPSIDYIGTGTIMPSAAIIESAAITSNYSISYATGTLTILIPARTYTITFYRNGAASIGGSTANYITRSCTIAAGNNASTCSITTPVIVGVTATPNVIGWGTEANSHTSTVAVNTSIDISDDGAYYAQTQSSQSSYSAMFYRNTATTIDGSSLASLTETCSTVRTYNGEAMLTTCNITTPTIEKSGYIILGWSTNATNPSSFIPANSPLAITSASNVYYAITGWNGNNMCSVTGAVSNPYNSAQCIFRGDNPNNYVRFNNTNYRIMSSDSNGKIKFIWNDSTLTGLTSYTYASGAAYTLINSGTYYTGLSSEALSFIEPTIFNIGTVGFYTNTDKYISDVAPAEATNSSSYMSGLLQVSEFLYASTAGGCTSTTPWSTFNKSPYVCTSSNWLLTGYPLHFINNHTASRIKYLKSDKQISYDTSTVSATIKPVHGFKAGVIFIAGSGTSTDPYIPFLNPQTCTIQTTNGYETSKLLTIVPSQATNLTYSWDNTTFNSTTTKTISSAGVFSGYIRTSGGLTNSCSILIASRQEYRVASCDTQWGSWQAGGYICYGTSYPSEQVAQSKQWAEATGASFYFSCGMSFNICNGEHSCRRYTRGCSRYNCGSFGNWTTTPSNSTCYQQVEIRTTYAPS